MCPGAAKGRRVFRHAGVPARRSAFRNVGVAISLKARDCFAPFAMTMVKVHFLDRAYVLMYVLRRGDQDDYC